MRERGLEQCGPEAEGEEIAQGLLRNFQVHCSVSLQPGVRCMFLDVAHESSEKFLHPTSMPECMQRERVVPLLGQCWRGIIGRETQYRAKDHSAEAWSQSQRRPE